MPYAHITGWGMSVPEPVMTNDDLARIVDTNDQWIRERTGIRERRIARENDFPSTLGTSAALRALSVANLKPSDLDLIICATSTPEHLFPATACLIQDNLGATRAGAFDLLAACTGFIYGLNMAAQSIRSGAIKNALVVGTETLSRFVDWTDRNTCILFGDGAGAFVVQASEQPGGILSAVMHSDGSGGNLLTLPAGGSRHPATEATIREGRHYIYMDGREVFRFATKVMASSTEEALRAAGLAKDDVSVIIPHQANFRIIDAAARGLKLPIDRFVINVDRYGNTSTASIPIAAVEAVERGRVKAGDKVVFVGFGAGLTWGALVAEWSGPLPSPRKVNVGRYRLLGRVLSVLRRVERFIEGLIWGRRA
ncbi:MAG: 3-oxoacyl-[acyl-carrier-protein] synthase 3 [Anaerolineaceae bacterium]|nr:ketoacyl-ACP synthase III [Anaerolineae bacterium]MCE7904460.1 ketoacyl-ACP synthase III [Anaerolineae bacterium CFX3]MDL1927179.1 ketoacyl-ACP synthase III [Anaerolineae bacterium AMX1]WKZ55861.1 MAG: beta-ketoacyl-ACP synthase III [Anaerolineales bacterium]GIK10345.1 MAG: 3-oxoacyl-[acyl-carrier-protein] synthase 3 [Chloroflexota bacterium]GJQ39860.1 MAG: 3-oxoacyl-[acyl-carrier-protein] synthase 3 [Anaerolineaceae bacterium]